ncbi:MAG: cell division protein SepF [Nitriliruptoraceae bacterium]|nr:cell division protein SepF [Nitriliruptoraceae bacterium]
MSQMWNRTLIYLGLREEAEELYDEVPQRFVPEDDPYAQHAPSRPNVARERDLVGATAGGRDGRGPERPGPRGDDRPSTGATRSTRATPDDGPRLVTAPEPDPRRESSSNVRPLRVGDAARPPADEAPAARVAVVEITRFDDVEAVGARYRTGQAVLFEIVAGSGGVGRRVVDFVAGLTYASHGTLTKAGSRAFLLVPDRVRIEPRELDRLRELGFRIPDAG